MNAVCNKTMTSCTCCQGEGYQPDTAALEVVLPGTTWGSSGHGGRLQSFCRSTKGLAVFLHRRTGYSIYLYRNSHIVYSKSHRRCGRVSSVCASAIKRVVRPGVQLKGRTLPVSLSPHSEALFSGCLSHRTWSTETGCRQKEKVQKINFIIASRYCEGFLSQHKRFHKMPYCSTFLYFF